MIKFENKNVLAYKLPSHYKKIDKNIGNKIEDFEILQVLGQGSYGFIAKVKSKLNGEIYAIKKNNFKNMDEERKKKLKKELVFLRKFDHPNVCKCLGSFEEDGNDYYIMKLFNSKDLFRYMLANHHMDIKIKEDIIWDIFLQCLEGLTYLHNQGVIHRDIKPGNIFIDDNRNIQIGDFGISAVMKESQAKNITDDPQIQKALILIPGEIIGTNQYMPPEVENGELYDQRFDVYSLGICFYALCFYNVPYINGNNMNEMRNDNFYSYELKNIIFKMIQRDQNERPTSSDIYCMFKKEYIEKYVKNSGIYSSIQCLFSFRNLDDFFSDNNSVSQAMENDYPKNVFYILVEIMQSLKNKKNIYEKIYALRKILQENGIERKDNEEIAPIECIRTILNSLKLELNSKSKKSLDDGKTEYLDIKDIAGKEGEKFENFIENYKSNFNSIISINFRGILKIQRKCNNGHINYLFRIFHYIPFNCDLLMEQLNKQSIINIYDCFSCLNKKQIILDVNKKVKCPDCKNWTNHIETKSFYYTPNNLIIFFDRGENNKNKVKIEFNEKIVFNMSQVEKNYGREYILVGITTEILENGKSKYISYVKKSNNWVSYDSGKENNEVKFKDLNLIKNTGNIISLFYYSSLINSLNIAPSYKNNNIFNNNININNPNNYNNSNYQNFYNKYINNNMYNNQNMQNYTNFNAALGNINNNNIGNYNNINFNNPMNNNNNFNQNMNNNFIPNFNINNLNNNMNNLFTNVNNNNFDNNMNNNFVNANNNMNNNMNNNFSNINNNQNFYNNMNNNNINNMMNNFNTNINPNYFDNNQINNNFNNGNNLNNFNNMNFANNMNNMNNGNMNNFGQFTNMK